MNNMPPITKNLLIINLLFFATDWVAGLYNIDLTQLLGLHFILSRDFQFYQLFTYMFMHGGFQHLFFNMFAVWMFGRIMEQTMGSRRFLFYYLTCGLGAGFMQEIVQLISYYYQGFNAYDQISIGNTVIAMDEFLNRWTTVGASGCVYGILLSFGMTFPNERMFIFPLPVPIKAKYFVMGYALIELYSALGRPADGIAHFAHLGGMLVGLLLLLYWRGGGGNRRYHGNYYDKGNYGNKNGFMKWFSSKTKRTNFKVSQGGKYSQDMEYNQREKQEDEMLNTILDKIKREGYSSLTEEEKKKLFEISNKK